MSRMRILLIGVVLCLAVATGCGQREARKIPVVRVAAVKAGRLPVVITFGGNLRSRVRASVGSNASGLVRQVFVQEGDRVTAGQPLMEIEAREMQTRAREQQAEIHTAGARVRELESGVALARVQYEADIQQATQVLRQERIGLEGARIQLSSAAKELDRRRQLLKGKAISRAEMESAELSWQLAKEQVRAAESKVAAAEQALNSARARNPQIQVQKEQLEGARSAYDQAVTEMSGMQAADAERIVRAPVAGSIVSVTAQPGQSVAPGGGGLFLIVDNSALELVASLDQRTYALVRSGARITFTPLDSSDKTFDARISDVIPTWDEKTRTVRVRFRVTGRDPHLMEGLAVRARMTVREERGMMVPLEALRRTNDEAYVVVISEDAAQRREVEVAYSNETHALISRGLKHGDWVATEMVADLHNGQAVQPRLK